MSEKVDFSALARRWRPARIKMQRTIGEVPSQAFGDVMDQPDPVADGVLPLLWHWFSFAPTAPSSALGADGHPSEGQLLPPFAKRRRMMAGGRIQQLEPFQTGRTYERLSEVTSKTAKTGRSGNLFFVTVQHTFHDDGGGLVAIEEEHAVYRQGNVDRSGTTRTRGDHVAEVNESKVTPIREPAARDRTLIWDGPGLTFASDPVTLFRFSALTYNAHRIHYDHPYATLVEGYPGLVVHGPYLALAMLEVPRRSERARADHFEYRLLAPTFSRDLIVVDVAEPSQLDSGANGSLSLVVHSGDLSSPRATGVVRYA